MSGGMPFMTAQDETTSRTAGASGTQKPGRPFGRSGIGSVDPRQFFFGGVAGQELISVS